MEHWTDYCQRNRISPEHPLNLLRRWSAESHTVGVFFIASARTAALIRARIHRASNSTLEVRDESGEYTSATFGLDGAKFQYGPVQVFPSWPAPPMVWVTGLSAWLKSGSWLFVWNPKSETEKPQMLSGSIQ